MSPRRTASPLVHSAQQPALKGVEPAGAWKEKSATARSGHKAALSVRSSTTATKTSYPAVTRTRLVGAAGSTKHPNGRAAQQE